MKGSHRVNEDTSNDNNTKIGYSDGVIEPNVAKHSGESSEDEITPLPSPDLQSQKWRRTGLVVQIGTKSQGPSPSILTKSRPPPSPARFSWRVHSERRDATKPNFSDLLRLNKEFLRHGVDAEDLRVALVFLKIGNLTNVDGAVREYEPQELHSPRLAKSLEQCRQAINRFIQAALHMLHTCSDENCVSHTIKIAKKHSARKADEAVYKRINSLVRRKKSICVQPSSPAIPRIRNAKIRRSSSPLVLRKKLNMHDLCGTSLTASSSIGTTSTQADTSTTGTGTVVTSSSSSSSSTTTTTTVAPSSVSGSPWRKQASAGPTVYVDVNEEEKVNNKGKTVDGFSPLPKRIGTLRKKKSKSQRRSARVFLGFQWIEDSADEVLLTRAVRALIGNKSWDFNAEDPEMITFVQKHALAKLTQYATQGELLFTKMGSVFNDLKTPPHDEERQYRMDDPDVLPFKYLRTHLVTDSAGLAPHEHEVMVIFEYLAKLVDPSFQLVAEIFAKASMGKHHAAPPKTTVRMVRLIVTGG